MNYEYRNYANGVTCRFPCWFNRSWRAALLTPILVLIGVNPALAVGTDLFYNSITKLFGTFQHWRQKTVNFNIVKYLAMGSVPSSIVAVALLHLSDSFYHNQEQIVKHALGYILIAVALTTLFRTIFDQNFKENRWQLTPSSQKKGLTILIGVILGFIVGLTSVRSLLVAIALLYFFRMSASELSRDGYRPCLPSRFCRRNYACWFWKCRFSPCH